MPPVLVLLSLLVGTLEVHAAPLDKGIRPEEMVTRCIVEVLSNALAKPNAPPIDPECKEILKKSSQHSLDEKEDEQKQYEARNIKDFGSMNKHQYESNEEVKQSQVLPEGENEEKRHDAEDKSKEEKEEEKKHVEDKEESTGHSKERDFVDDDEDDGDDEERADHKNHNGKEEIEKKDKYHHDNSQEAKHNIFDKTVHQTAKSVEEFSEEDDKPSHLEEIMKRHPITLSPKEPLFHSDKYHSAHADDISEESDEKEEERKRSYKKPDDFVQRLLDYEEKRSHQEEQRNHVPSDEDTFHYRGQKSHYGKDSFENHLKNSYEKRTHHERESSEESREKRHHHQDREEEKDHFDSNDESNEKELVGHHYEDKKHHLEIKRWPSQKIAQSNYEQSNEDSEESKEDIEKRHKDDRLEKQELYRKLKHFQDSEEDGSYKQDRKQEDKRRYIGDEMVDEMKRYYPDLSYEQNMRHNEKNTEHSNYPGNDKYKRRHSEEETRSFSKYGIPDDPFRWKNRYVENDNSEEERKRSLQTKNLFPDYDDYDLWGKKQFLDELNHEYGEKKNPVKIPKFEEKRQYDRMDELAQLLNYKKKSVEFPDFYDSGEIKKRHYNERNRVHQRPLTEEEEKELENLAIMDLELQKIAEKLSNNRQG